MSFSDELRRAAAPIWAAQIEHPFVRGIGDGSLASEKFRHYIRQDYLFLLDYARLLALGSARAPGVEAMTRFAQLADAVLTRELDLHRSYARDWGVATADLEQEQPTLTTRAYTDFLLRVAALGDYAELVAALLPCMWGYHELGTKLADHERPGDELYARWVDLYSDPEFGELAGWCRRLTDEASRSGDHARMLEAFLTSSQYELAFWDASWRMEPPLVRAGAAPRHIADS
jgi:thiaminase/transcriptional activator TenA